MMPSLRRLRSLPPPLLIVVVSSAFLLHLTHAGRAYPHGCSSKPQSYYDYDDASANPLPSRSSTLRRSYDDFLLLRRLGAGKFSDVFEAVDVDLERRLAALSLSSSSSSSSSSGSVGGGEDAVYGTEEGRSAPPAVDPRCLVVIKCLKPVSVRKIRRELLVLSHASNLPNLARLRGVVLPDGFADDGHHGHHHQRAGGGGGSNSGGGGSESGGKGLPSLVLEHAGPHARWLCHGRGCDPTVLPAATTAEGAGATTNAGASNNGDVGKQDDRYLSEREMKYYLCHLLLALDALHSRGIMHRDVKPRNVLINRSFTRHRRRSRDAGASVDPVNDDQLHAESRQRGPTYAPLMLIDLGLADFYLPGHRYNVRVASRHYKSPELLVGYELYDYAIDLWGVGCILAGLLLRREPFFRGKDNVDQLGKIVSVLGTRDLLDYCRKCSLKLSSEIRTAISKYSTRSSPDGTRKSWHSLLPSSCPVPSKEGLDLLDQLLVYDHDQRLTAREAMAHPFFDEVREEVTTEVRQRWEGRRHQNSELNWG